MRAEYQRPGCLAGLPPAGRFVATARLLSRGDRLNETGGRRRGGGVMRGVAFREGESRGCVASLPPAGRYQANARRRSREGRQDRTEGGVAIGGDDRFID